jgi:peptidoglycan/xylan/chitin deacetylase (PgdA/CDA1 family)
MKRKLGCILFIFVSIFFIIFIFEENFSIVYSAINELSNGQIVENEKITKHKEKIIYLTFDDGPSYKVTNKVLDILKENEVQGTFFLIGNQIKDKKDVVKRIYEEGNGIGLHTYTHNFKKIYSDEDKFIQEMIICRSEINETIGVAPKIIRFPGGSYKHLNKNYLKKLHDNDFRVYDWNADNSDGLNPKSSPYNLYTKAIKGSEGIQSIVLLMHCTDMNKNTCQALPKIIEYYKSNAYEFKIITEETTELYFPIKR